VKRRADIPWILRHYWHRDDGNLRKAGDFMST
jgi:hypothetical protein